MSLLSSARNGYQMLGFAGLVKGLLIVWLLPSVVALVALALQWLFGTVALGSAGMMMWAATILLLMSPVLSWLGLVLAGSVVSALMDRGWFGWIPAIVLGLLVGSLIAWLMDHELAISFGAFLILALRAVLGRLCPAAFDPDGA
jgi:hypothetical protein